MRFGTWGWRHDGWRGVFYPDDLPADWQLGYYSNEFDTVLVPQEYSLTGDPGQVEEWLEDVADSFLFFVEWPADRREISAVSDALSGLGEHLGGIVLTRRSCREIPPEWQPRVYADAAAGTLWRPESGPSGHVCRLGLVEQAPREPRELRALLESFNSVHGEVLLFSGQCPDVDALRDARTLAQWMDV
jgi:hypothetical protein